MVMIQWIAMTKHNTKKYAVTAGILVVAGAVAVFLPRHANQPEGSTTVPVHETPSVTKPVVIQNEQYTTLTLQTNNPIKEISTAVGASNVGVVLKLNRINSNYLKKDSVVVIPQHPNDWMALSPFPLTLSSAASIPKIDLISQRVQAFGVYEYGKLVRWGPVSTGKASTPTASKLYFTNWKGKEVHSSFSDEWILKWNFNLDNAEGIGMHQYTMPGYPASHSCVRMFGEDAEWLYNWADQWVVSDDEQTIIAHGTPVLVFGSYAYNKTAPWKLLPQNPDATTLSPTELDQALTPALPTIDQYAHERTSVN